MSEPTPPTLAAQFAQRLLERDAPPPPPSQELEAVLDRIQAWLLPPGGTRDTRTHRRQARMLVALMQHPERSTEQLTAASGLEWRAGSRMSLVLFERGLTHRERRGRYFYHRLTRAAEDALLLVVAG
ncbi:helix-turn-helix transcriptional regulator [Hymenobacter sp. ASUV-10]|uniref:Helix-turn-helix transcriptional regulator n=1 Tax=Hymenobacter aranciens TaxID=3063996 RepID=A0ABT9BC63_9BACT|nr:helix-turn-helix transcriptional regulator [Hymenobacter sp. ASUV-10]MDO7875849.1 helix-turn-helix transcriptional regulator [Hymenobacter sp. ASUV-10]